MTDQYKLQFLKVYNECADDIFASCYKKIAHREIAKYLTRNIFMKTWDVVSLAKTGIRGIEKTLYNTANDMINGFVSSNRYQTNYNDTLWNLTLSQ